METIYQGFCIDPVVHVYGTIRANRGTSERSPYHDTPDSIYIGDHHLDHRNYTRPRARFIFTFLFVRES